MWYKFHSNNIIIICAFLNIGKHFNMYIIFETVFIFMHLPEHENKTTANINNSTILNISFN